MSRVPVLWTCLAVTGLFAVSAVSTVACSAVSKVDFTECSDSASCRDAFGLGWQCGDAGLCVAAEANPRCKETYPDDLLKNPDDYRDWIVLGSLFDHNNNDGDGKLVNSASLAVEDANGSGLTDGRKYAIVHCDYQESSDFDGATSEQAAVEGARYLVDVYGVPAIVGPGTSSLAEAVYVELQKTDDHPSPTLLISPSATSPALTDIDVRDGDKPGLFWRTAPPDSLLGEVLASRMAKGDADLGDMAVTEAAIIFTKDTYGQGLATELDKNFTGTLHSYSYDDPKNIGSLVIKASTDLAGKAGPKFGMVFIGSTVEDVVDFLNAAANPGLADFYANVTFFLGDAAYNQDVISRTAANASGLYPKIRGVFPGSPFGPVYNNFTTAYSTTFDGEVATDSSYSSQTYDATWLAIYGTAWAEYQREGVLDGLNLAYGLQQISAPGGVAIEVGAVDWNTVKREFKAGRPINVTGASGNLDYDPETEETKAPVIFWKINDAGTKFETVETVSP